MDPPPPVQNTTLLSIGASTAVQLSAKNSRVALTEDSVSPDIADIFVSILRHGNFVIWYTAGDELDEGWRKELGEILKLESVLKLTF